MGLTNSMLLTPPAVPRDEARFQDGDSDGGGDGGFTCEIGPRSRVQRCPRNDRGATRRIRIGTPQAFPFSQATESLWLVRETASNRVFDVAVVGFEQLVDVWNVANAVTITTQVMSLSGANVALQVLRLDGTLIAEDNQALAFADGAVTLTVPAWDLSGEGIVTIRVTVTSPTIGVSVRFNDAVLGVVP